MSATNIKESSDGFNVLNSADSTRRLSAAPDSAAHLGCEHDNPNQHPYRPVPDPKTGELVIDPDIVLTAKKFDLQLSFYYSSRSTTSREFGVGRCASVGGVILASNPIVTYATVVRGDLRYFGYSMVPGVGSIKAFNAIGEQGAATTLSYDGTQFTEYFNDGMQIIYKPQSTGGTVFTCPIVQVLDASGVAQTYTYGTGAAADLLQSITLPGNNVVSFLYTSGVATSLLQTVQDWSNRRWTFQYDSQNYMTTMTTPLGCQTGYAYSLAGSPVTLVQAITDPRGFTTSYIYDSMQRVTQMQSGSATWTYAYNVGIGPGGTANVVMTSPTGALTTTVYDNQGNIGFVQRPEGYTSSYAYDQVSYLRISETIPAGTISSIAYDQNLWLPLVSVDALGFRTSMQYDQFGNLTTLISADGGVTTHSYFGSGSTHLRASSTDPNGRVSAYSYTSDGLLLSATDPRNLTTTYAYDQFGNPVTIMASDRTITTLTYDNLSNYSDAH